MSVIREELIGQIKGMTVRELTDIVKALQEEFGVSATRVGPVTDRDHDKIVPAPEPAKTAFDVVLTAAGDKKIQVIKVVREITGLGLKEAKEVVDAAPRAVKEGITEEEAEKIKAILAAEGAIVEIK